ncbi:dipeptidase [Kordiimonas sediminis]|uniref:Dipeptidase n=1 Tax=Kordiimonas sediminis TaxID=1735581 RepID=A0A919AU19_9PROT|nr:dipeptidase [Kordiimonas sediminis]GHF22949.1 dipeptidase [Kordiimonas sediminis]
MKLVKWILGLVVLAGVFAVTYGHHLMDRRLNASIDHEDFVILDKARSLHQGLTIMDWHSDTLLWERDFLDENSYGHVDLPRMQQGNIGLMMLTTVTKSPDGQNYVENEGDSDRLTSLHMMQMWPMRTWNSLFERAIYQAEKLDRYVDKSNGQMIWIKTQEDLLRVLAEREVARASGKTPPTGFLLGAEGAHPLEGKIENLDKMIDAGYSMIGLTHFFDNELGGSLHGTSKAGLTDFGREVVQALNEKEIIIDMAHASEKVAWEVLANTDRPFVVSHTGIKGACDSPRNYPDDLMKAIADRGGLIAIGYWDAAICEPTPTGIAKTVKYAVELLGEDHVALGSDWDGSIQTTVSSNEMVAITSALMEAGLTDTQIRKVMGGNSVEFLRKWLPSKTPS